MQNILALIFYLNGVAEIFPSVQHKFHGMLVISVSFQYAVSSSENVTYNVR